MKKLFYFVILIGCTTTAVCFAQYDDSLTDAQYLKKYRMSDEDLNRFRETLRRPPYQQLMEPLQDFISPTKLEVYPVRGKIDDAIRQLTSHGLRVISCRRSVSPLIICESANNEKISNELLIKLYEYTVYNSNAPLFYSVKRAMIY